MFWDHKALKKLWICSNPNLQNSSLQTFCDIELLRNFKLMSSLRIRKWVKLSDRKKSPKYVLTGKEKSVDFLSSHFFLMMVYTLCCVKKPYATTVNNTFYQKIWLKILAENNFEKCSLIKELVKTIIL